MWIGRPNVVKMWVLSYLIYRFNAIEIKIPASCFVDISRLVLRFMWRSQSPRITNTILKGKNELGGLILPDFKTYYNVTVIKTVWCWWKNRWRDQWNWNNGSKYRPSYIANRSFTGWITDITIKHKAVKSLKYNIGGESQ